MNKLLAKRIRITKRYEFDLISIIWFLLAAAAVISEMARGMGSIDNYLIFRGVFYHVLEQKNLFIYYPGEYASFNNYGPAFSLIIAPFAVLPIYLGCFLWCLTNAALLFIAIRMLPISHQQKILIYWICCIEMMTSIHSVQSNPMLTAFLIFAYVFTIRGKDWIATLFIVAGLLSKVYGIAGLVFFFFSGNKKQFILSFLGWMLLFITLPMLYSSYEYIIDTYKKWYFQIVMRNQQNIDNSLGAGMQDISLPGMIRRIFKYQQVSDLKLIAAAGLLMFIPLLKKANQLSQKFQLQYLAMVLISIVIFSSAAESPTFVIAVTGAAIWISLLPKPFGLGSKTLLVSLFLLTILSPTDLIPAYLRINIIRTYSLKALPCTIIWLCLLYQLWQKHLPEKIKA